MGAVIRNDKGLQAQFASTTLHTTVTKHAYILKLNLDAAIPMISGNHHSTSNRNTLNSPISFPPAPWTPNSSHYTLDWKLTLENDPGNMSIKY